MRRDSVIYCFANPEEIQSKRETLLLACNDSVVAQIYCDSSPTARPSLTALKSNLATYSNHRLVVSKLSDLSVSTMGLIQTFETINRHNLEVYILEEERTLTATEMNLMVQLYRIENEIFRSAKIKTALQSSPKGGRRKIKFNLQEARNMRSMNMSWSQIASALSQKGERVSPSTVRRGLKIMNEEMAIV